MIDMLDELESYGLTPIQAKVYLHLVRLGRTSSIAIARAIGVHRSEIYRVLRELVEKGIASENASDRPAQYEAKPPATALSLLLRQRVEETERIKNQMPKLIRWLDSRHQADRTHGKVLLIDDDETIRTSLSHSLRHAGFIVDTARDGQEALAKSRRKVFDVALVDIRLPDMEGTELLSRLRSDNPEINRIIVTGYPSVQNAARAIEQGAEGYVTKPFDTLALITKIKEKLKE
jgi:CheY-like chemotaxis protein/DNA-binding MarR family transcriptional regulator